MRPWALRRLRTFVIRLDEAKRQEWDRSLPIPDLIGDRWHRASRLGFGDGASIYDSSLVLGEVAVGEHTWIGPNTILDGSGGRLEIGTWCTVSAGVQLYTHDTVRRSLSGGVAERLEAPVRIGDNTYLGPNSVVAAGVTIGRMCVVATNSFVNCHVGERTVVGGTPARPIGRVEGEAGDIQLVLGDR